MNTTTATRTPLIDRLVRRVLDWADAQDEPSQSLAYSDVMWCDLRTGDLTIDDASPRPANFHGWGWPIPPMTEAERTSLLEASRPHAERAAALYRWAPGDEWSEARVSRRCDRALRPIAWLVEDAASRHESTRADRRVDAVVAEIHSVTGE